MEKVIINPSYGGNNSGKVNNNFIEKNFNLNLAKELQKQLNNMGINSYLVRDSDINLSNEERLNIINSFIEPNDTTILITFELIENEDNLSGAKIVYSLRDNDNLSKDIANNLENINVDIIKYYQQRDPNNTYSDFYFFVKNPSNSINTIISLGNQNNTSDNNFMLNNINKIANSIATSINTYLKKDNIYIVQRGDTLYSIANKFNTSIDAIKEANNLISNALIIGSELIIPNQNINVGDDQKENMYVNYKVKQGDSLYSIAKSYNTTVDILKDINNLTNNTLSINQTLKIPVASSSTITNYNNYEVKSGDSLYAIAKKFNISINDIIDLNNLTSNTLSIGQVLKIPTSEGTEELINNYSTYTVQSGDSLYKIAGLFSTSVNKLKDLNNLTSNTLSIGQVLKIPTNTENENKYLTYTVKSGDSLYKIANQYNVSVANIKSLNNLESNILSIGQVLKIKNT